MPQGMGADATVVPIEFSHDGFDDTLNGGFAHGSLGRMVHGVVFAFGGKEPNWVSMSAVVVSHDLEGRLRERNETVLGTLATMDMDQHAFGVNIVDLEMEGFLKPKSQGIDDGEEAMHGGFLNQLEERLHFRHREDRWDFLFHLDSDELESLPIPGACQSEELFEGLVSDVDGGGFPLLAFRDMEEVTS